MKEKWKDIKGSDGLYEISNHGRVRSHSAWKKGGLLSSIKSGSGYLYVNIPYVGKKKMPVYIHRLVADHFCKNMDSKNNDCIDHIDDDKLNNHYLNLEHVTRAENVIRAGLAGRMPRGSKNKNSKLNKEKVIEIKNLLEVGWFTQKEIANGYDIDPAIISNIKRGVNWAWV